MKKIGLLFIVLTLVFSLFACKDKVDEDQVIYDAAYTALDIVVPGGDNEAVIASFTVPTALRGDVVATWTSSDTVHAAITTAGAITTVNVVRPAFGEGNASVTLTAALSYNEKSGTKTFDIIILEEPEGVIVMTLSEIKGTEVTYDESSTYYLSDIKGETVRIADVTVVGLDSDAYYISDGVTAMMIYGAPGATIVLGQKGSVLATVDLYFGAYQLKSATWSGVTQNSVIAPKEIDLADYWLAADADRATRIAAKTDLTLGDYVTFDAVVDYRADFIGGSSYMLTLVDPNAASHDVDFVLSYYKGPLHDDLAAYDGLTVTFTALVRELRDDRTTNSTIGARPVYSLSIQSLVLPTLDANQKATVDMNLIDIETAFTEAGTLVLPTTGTSQASTITWAFTDSDDTNNTFINLTSGAVTMPVDVQVEVGLTATITNGTAVLTRNFVIAVGQFPITDMADLKDPLLFADGDIIRVKGILTALTKTGGFWIQDATGGLNIYTYGAFLDTLNDAAFGVEFDMVGELDIFNGLFEIKNLTALEITNSTPAIPTPISLNDVEFTNTALLPYQAQLVSFDGFVLKYDVTATSDSFSATLVNPVSDKQISVRVESSLGTYTETLAFFAALSAGDAVDVSGAILGWYNGYQGAATNVSNFTAGTAIPEATLAAYAETKLSVPTADQEVTADLTLPTTGLFGATVAWSSSNTAVISNAGVVTRPAAGAANETVTLSYTVTLGGTVRTTVTVDVIVVAEPATATVASDLFISEYIEGGSYNKAVEIFNGTGATVDLSIYTIELHTSAATAASQTYTMTGTLADGEVFVLSRTDAIAAITDQADALNSSVVNWNGDDAVVLLKNGVIIDIVGILGTDPGDYWTVGTGSTKDYTLVRDASVTGPNATFTASEWVVNPKDSADFIGSHTMN